MRVVNPVAASHTEPIDPAERLASLQGKVLALLHNSKSNAPEFFGALAQELQARYGLAEVILTHKPSASRAADEAHLHQLAGRAAGLVTGFAD